MKVVIASLAAALSLVACSGAVEPVSPEADTNQLSGFDQETFYHLDQGSGIYPYAWAKALVDRQTGKPFLENIERFGLIPDAITAQNPDGLAIGLTVAKSPAVGMDMLGITCAACHTSELHVGRDRVRIDGGAGLFAIDKFYGELFESTKATLTDPQELLAFINRLNAQTREQLKSKSTRRKVASLLGNLVDRVLPSEDGSAPMSSLLDDLQRLTQDKELGQELTKQLIERIGDSSQGEDRDGSNPLDRREEAKQILERLSKTTESVSRAGDRQSVDLISNLLSNVDETVRLMQERLRFLEKLPQVREGSLAAGNGRADDFGVARNMLFDPVNHRNATAPVSIPPIWHAREMYWLHWNANTNSVIERNLGEALGVGALLDAESKQSTVHLSNQMLLEELSYQITPPTWPRQFGIPSEQKVRAGRAHYEEHCQHCHDAAQRNEHGLLEFPLFSLDEIGTDPNVAVNFDQPLTSYQAQSNVKFTTAVAKILNEIKAKSVEQLSKDDLARLERLEAGRTPVQWRSVLSDTVDKTVYPAKPLEGIWATAPYLHNGSVPTLFHLLLPPSQRPTSFPLGHFDFDVNRLGFHTDLLKVNPEMRAHVFAYDTSVSGNTNTGHEYGLDLTDSEKTELLEYLKVHKNPSW